LGTEDLTRGHGYRFLGKLQDGHWEMTSGNKKQDIGTALSGRLNIKRNLPLISSP